MQQLDDFFLFKTVACRHTAIKAVTVIKPDLQLRKRRRKVKRVVAAVNVQHVNLQSSKDSTNFHLQIAHNTFFVFHTRNIIYL